MVDSGSEPDPTADAAVELLRAVGANDVDPGDHRALLIGLAGLGSLVSARLDRGTIDHREASALLRQGFVVHQLLKRRAAARPAVDLRRELTESAERLCVDVGFERVMGFLVGDRALDVVVTRFAEQPAWSDAIHATAVEAPPELDLAVREAEVVDGQRAVLVSGAQQDPATWKPIVNPLGTESYVAAPIVVGDRTVATLHADCFFSGRSMTVTDQRIIGLVAEEISSGLRAADDGSRSVLTDQQVKVMELLARGASNAEIARSLYVSPETIKAHLRNIYRRLDVSNRVEAVGRFYDLGP